MKKVLSIVLTIAMVISLMPSVVFAAEKATYTDIKGLKCEAAVEQLTELGIINGYEDGTFRPENNVTRAEMSKLTVAALGLNPTSGTTKFTDMDQAKWAIPYVGYAESLGIVKGYGNGKFGPNDKVTYDQAITMIVRMLGYTDDSTELQGTWPANYIQKANELGILKDVDKTGSDPAPRGDIAIMLANALDIAMVYVDKDGKTEYKTGKDRANVDDFDNPRYVTVRGTLTKEAYTGYATITDTDVNNAAKNIREHLGAAGKIVTNEDEEIISVSDIKTQFMTGKYDRNKNIFTSDDVDYKVSNPLPTKELNWRTGKPQDAETIPFFMNGERFSGEGVPIVPIDNPSSQLEKPTVTIAATVDGKKITGIYSVQAWFVTKHAKVDAAQLAQIEKNHTLLGEAFVENDDDEIDMDSFILAGVDSLDKIAEDNVVYVYSNSKGIAKVEVGTETVSGKVTKSNVGSGDPYAVIDGTKYSFAANAKPDAVANAKAGNEVDAYLDYNGDIYAAEKISSDNYAVVMEVEKPFAKSNSFSSNNKIKLLTADGPQIFEVNNSKFKIDGEEPSEGTWNAWNALEGQIVKVTFADEKVKEINVMEAKTVNVDTLVSKQGYFDSKKINDKAMIYAVPYANGAAVWNKDDENYVAKEKADILDTKIKATYYAEGGKIEVMYFDDSAISESEFGVAYDQYSNEDGDTVTQYYVGKETAEGVGVAPTFGTDLYEISKASDGSVTFVDAPNKL